VSEENFWTLGYKGRLTEADTLTIRLGALYNTPAVWTKWKGLVADDVVHAAGTSILSLARGVFAGMHSACSGPGGLPRGSV